MNKLDLALEQVDKIFEKKCEKNSKQYSGCFFQITIDCLKLAASNADKGLNQEKTEKINIICEKAMQEERISNENLPELSLI